MAGSSYYKKTISKRNYSNKKNYYSKPYNRYSNNLISRAVKSMRECNNSNSTIDFAYKINYAFTAMYDSSSKAGVAAINLYHVLCQSQNFRNMSKNWDQVKINGAQVRLNICDAVLSYADISNIKSINVITGWDRTGLSLNEVDFYDNTGSTVVKNDWDDTPAGHFRNKIGEKIAAGYGCKKGLVNSYQRFSRYESIYPKKLEEKSCFVPTSTMELYENEDQRDPNTGIVGITDGFSNQNIMSQIAQPNPCVPFENSIKWKPTLLVGVFSTTIDRESQPQTVNPDWINWSLAHPTVGEANEYNNEILSIGNNRVNFASEDANVFGPIFEQFVKPFSESYNDFVARVLTANQQTALNGLTNDQKEIIQNKITANTTSWITANNPNRQTIDNPNAGNTIGRVSQYGSVKPIVFNGEFTIAVSFNQQKGDV